MALTKTEVEVEMPAGFEDAQPVANERTDAKADRCWPLTEAGNAERFAWRYNRQFVYTDATGWMYYDATDGQWKIDKVARVDQAMVRTIRLILDEWELFGSGDEKIKSAYVGWAKKCESHAKIVSSINRASKLDAFIRNYADFDQRPELFNCANGTFNLDTLEFRPHDPADLLTKGSNIIFDPKAECPQFEKFLLEVMNDDKEMRKYLCRCAGYTLSAFTNEQCMFVPYGLGGSGKSTFLHVLAGIMGTYCAVSDGEMFMAKRGDSGQPFELAGKDGVRALLAAETEEGKRFASAKIKRMTGQDKVRACYKFQQDYEFLPVWKIWLATNDRPTVQASDDAMWDRVKPIPFDIKFRGTDRQIKDLDQILLRAEGPGILRWMLAGFKMWRKDGLMHPEKVVQAIIDWHESEDYLQRFLDERTVRTDIVEEMVSKAKLFEMFSSWAEDSKEGRGVNNKQFSEMMKRKGYKADVRNVGGKSIRVWLTLKATSVVDSWHPDPKIDYGV